MTCSRSPARRRRRPRGSPSTSPRWPKTRWSGGRLPRAKPRRPWRPADLAHVVDNLIENAVRYTAPGAQVTVESSSENGQGTLVVADNGPGIPEVDRARVFERFYRGSNGRRLGPGTGLGLAIVAELVERWDGQVTLANGPGTRVQVVFRQTPADR
jgi:signal transduction histidine kinase